MSDYEHNIMRLEQISHVMQLLHNSINVDSPEPVLFRSLYFAVVNYWSILNTIWPEDESSILLDKALLSDRAA